MWRSLSRLMSGAPQFSVKVRYIPKRAAEADLKPILTSDFKLKHFSKFSVLDFNTEEEALHATELLRDAKFMGNVLR